MVQRNCSRACDSILVLIPINVHGMVKDRSRRPEGGEWEPIKISLKFETSAYVPKSPQALEPRSARIAMNKLSRSRRPRLQRGSKASRNAELDCRDRSDRCNTPVRLVTPVRPVEGTGQTGRSQKTREQDFKS